MYGQRQGMGERLQEVIRIFRSKGALSPETAMTAKDLGLPPRFEEAKHRRLGQSGVIVEVNGRYYLDEQRLEQVKTNQQERRQGKKPPLMMG